MRNRNVLGLVLAALALGGAACKIQGERRPYQPLGAGAAALRAAFNADTGKVRLIVLVAPT
jgi:hypothetical protein